MIFQRAKLSANPYKFKISEFPNKIFKAAMKEELIIVQRKYLTSIEEYEIIMNEFDITTLFDYIDRVNEVFNRLTNCRQLDHEIQK
jgi:hypothetical protein